MKLNSNNEKGVLTIYLEGELDHHTAKPMRECIDEITQKEGFKTLVLDFTCIGFMDSSGIGLVLSRFKDMKARGIGVKVSGTKGYTKKIFELAGVTKIIPFIETAKG